MPDSHLANGPSAGGARRGLADGIPTAASGSLPSRPGRPSSRAILAAAAASLVIAAAACSAPNLTSPLDQGAADTPTARVEIPTPVPEPKMLVVCLAEEPDSFYPFGPQNPSARALLPLLFDGPVNVLDFAAQPVILDGLPSEEKGSVRLETVSVQTGDLYFNPASRLPDELRAGKMVLPPGCRSPDCARKYEGGGTQTDRMIVEFRLKPGLTWSDGTPLTSSDSVYAYRLDSDPATPSIKDQVNRTAMYEAVDPETVRWTGIPGYLDAEYVSDFWSPLPEHLWGSIAAADLPDDPTARQKPIGWGPYVLASWDAGKSMVFDPNPGYADWPAAGPAFERLLVRFPQERGEAAIQQLITGECDVVEEGLLGLDSLASVESLAGQGRVRWTTASGPVVERIDFDTDPVDERPRVLADPSVRKALAMCIDRQALIDQKVVGQGVLPVAYLPGNHPLAGEDLPGLRHDPQAAAEALTGAGWVDEDGDPATPRVARGAAGVPAGTPLRLTLLTSQDDFHQGLAAAIGEDLGTCGVSVDVQTAPSEALYQTWPDGPAFGRRFDLVLWPWYQWIVPECDTFTSAEIPSANNERGSNATGFSDARFDAACAKVAMGPVTGAGYQEAARETERLFVDQVPGFSVLAWPRFLAFSVQLCGPKADATVSSLFWNISQWTDAQGCQP
jgi:peptide/nickel transport system substrate-binding protein